MKSAFVRRQEVEVGLIMVGQSEGQKITRKNVCGLVCGETLLHPLVPRPTIFTLALDRQLYTVRSLPFVGLL